MLTFWGREAGHAHLSRRSFLQVGALGAGLSLADLFRLRAHAGNEAKARRKSVIMVLLGGGPSHIDMYDMKPEAPVEMRGEFKPIRTNVPGFDICELFPEQAKIADRLALVRNLRMSTSDHSHEQECLTGFMTVPGVPGASGDPRPAFGSIVSRLRGGNDVIPSYISLSGQHQHREIPLHLGPSHRPFHASGPDVENLNLPKTVTLDRLGDRQALLRSLDNVQRSVDVRGDLVGLDAYQAKAFEMLGTNRARDAFDLNREPDRVKVRYGMTPNVVSYDPRYITGSQFLTARRLVEAGVSVVTLNFGAFGHWDTHAENFSKLRQYLPALDVCISALVRDLNDRGLDKDVAVCVWGEMGRTPQINKEAGRDHLGNANFVLLAGGDFKRGQVIGATDKRGERCVGRPYRPQNVLATLYQHLGIDTDISFPDHNGRPLTLLDDRAPIAELS